MAEHGPPASNTPFLRPVVNLDKVPDSIKAKWPDREVLQEGFMPIPKRLVRCLHQLFANEEQVDELRALLVYVDFLRERMPRLPSIAHLAFTAGMSEADYTAAANRLAARNLWTITRSGGEGFEANLEPLHRRIKELTPDGLSPRDDRASGPFPGEPHIPF